MRCEREATAFRPVKPPSLARSTPPSPRGAPRQKSYKLRTDREKRVLEEMTTADVEERFEAYRDRGVRNWVRNTLHGMTDRAAANLTGIGATDTYTPEDGSGELNMGLDIHRWKVAARNETASDTREQKRVWLTTIREVLIAELHSVIADQTAAADAAAFKARCRALLGRIPDPYW